MNALIKSDYLINPLMASGRFSVQLDMDLNIASHAETSAHDEPVLARGIGTKKQGKPFTFIDLFAGIGGFRLALTSLGGQCVFSSEWDAAAQKTYFANFGELPHGDITLESTKDAVPDGFDMLCARWRLNEWRKMDA